MGFALICVLVLTLSFARAENSSSSSGSGSSSGQSSSTELEINSLDALDGKRIGILCGSNYDRIIKQNLSGTYELKYYNTHSDMIFALKSHKIDAFPTDEPVGLLAINRNSGIGIVPKHVADDDYGFFFKKGSPLANKFSGVIESLKSDGTLNRLKENGAAPTSPPRPYPNRTGRRRTAPSRWQRPASRSPLPT